MWKRVIETSLFSSHKTPSLSLSLSSESEGERWQWGRKTWWRFWSLALTTESTEESSSTTSLKPSSSATPTPTRFLNSTWFCSIPFTETMGYPRSMSVSRLIIFGQLCFLFWCFVVNSVNSCYSVCCFHGCSNRFFLRPRWSRRARAFPWWGYAPFLFPLYVLHIVF